MNLERQADGPSLRGKQVVFTGRLAAMTHDDAADLVRRRGGSIAEETTDATDLVVIGQEGWPFRKDGHITHNLARAKGLLDQGAALSVVDEQGFLEMCGLGGEDAAAELTRLYSITQLSRVLDVPAVRIRAWVRRGLIAPVRHVQRVPYFDFPQVAAAKTLRQLTDSGVSVDRIQRSLRAVERWLPDAEDAITRLTLMDEGVLAVRLADGGTAEASGQIHLPLDEDADATPQIVDIQSVLDAEPSTPDEWFERAVALEDAERLEEAAEAYKQCLKRVEVDPEAAFNFGNVLLSLNRVDEATKWLRQATEWDAEYAEAWVNLAGACVDSGRWDEAARAARRALQIAPGYTDAHYNLALALHGLGRIREAKLHARAYLLHDPRSEWALLLRSRLGLHGGA